MTPRFSDVVAPHEAQGLPPCPDKSIWPYLDAAVRCVERFGWSRTTVKDIATEAGVERTTVYRRVGSMDQVFPLLVARELHLLIESLPSATPEGADGPVLAVELLATAVERCLAHPVISKILVDEPEVAARFLARGVPDVIQQIAVTIGPMFARAMDAGRFARRDPVVLAEWIARVGLSLLLAPPPGDLRVFLREILDPVLRMRPADPGVTS